MDDKKITPFGTEGAPKKWSAQLAKDVREFDAEITLTLPPEQAEALRSVFGSGNLTITPEMVGQPILDLLLEGMDPELKAKISTRIGMRDPAPQPRPFSVNLAVTVRAYGSVCVMATSMAEAIETVRAQAEGDCNNSPLDENVWDQVTDVDWSGQTDYTISSIQDDEGDDPPHDDLVLSDEDGDIISAEQLAAMLEGEA